MIQATTSAHVVKSAIVYDYLNRGKPIGKFVLVPDKINTDTVILCNVEIVEKFRNKGHGRKMMKELIDFVRQYLPQYKSIWLMADKVGVAHTLYLKSGFVKSGEAGKVIEMKFTL